MATKTGKPAAQAEAIDTAKSVPPALGKKSLFRSKWLPFLLSLLFLIVFESVYFSGKTGARASSDIANPDLLRWFDDLGVLI